MPRVDPNTSRFSFALALSLLVLRELGSLTDVSHPVGEQRFRRRPFDSLTLRLGESSRNQNNDLLIALGGLGCGVNFQVFGSVAVPSYLTYTSAKCSAPALDAARAITTVFEKRCHN